MAGIKLVRLFKVNAVFKYLILFILSVFCKQSIKAFNIGQINYQTDEVTRTATVTQSPDAQGDITIPDEIYLNNITYTVKRIGTSAFLNCELLTSVNIPRSITNIGTSAFDGCTALKTITIPDSIRKIEAGTFQNCTNLSAVNFPNNLDTIGRAAFYGCSHILGITLPKSLKVIEEAAFQDCTNLRSIDLPDSVTQLGYKAFEYCLKLTTVWLPVSITTIKGGVFMNDRIQALHVAWNKPLELPYEQVFYNADIDTLYVPAGGLQLYATSPWNIAHHLVEESTTTTIHTVKNHSLLPKNTCYDLQGRRTTLSAGGIYIKNRKKIWMKR
jgi:hypothetical protein